MNYLKNKFENFLKNNSIEIIPSEFNQHELIDMYFNTKAPFSEQKKHEFPDAIILLSLLQYSKDKNKELIIVSNDNGFELFCENKGIKHYKYISDVINQLNIENIEKEIIYIYNNSFEKIKQKIIDEIKSNTDEFILYSYDSIDEVYVDNIEIIDINIENVNIINIDIDSYLIEVEINTNIAFNLNASYADENNMHYDKEDNVYYCLGKINADIQLIEQVFCSAKIYFDKDVKDFDYLGDFEIINKEFEFSLNEHTIKYTEWEEVFHAI